MQTESDTEDVGSGAVACGRRMGPLSSVGLAASHGMYDGDMIMGMHMRLPRKTRLTSVARMAILHANILSAWLVKKMFLATEDHWIKGAPRAPK